MGLCGVIAAVAMSLLTHAYRMASANLVTVFEYTGMIWVPLWGFLFFAEVPKLTTVIGTAIIIAAGIFAVRSAQRAGSRAPRPRSGCGSRRRSSCRPPALPATRSHRPLPSARPGMAKVRLSADCGRLKLMTGRPEASSWPSGSTITSTDRRHASAGSTPAGGIYSIAVTLCARVALESDQDVQFLVRLGDGQERIVLAVEQVAEAVAVLACRPSGRRRSSHRAPGRSASVARAGMASDFSHDRCRAPPHRPSAGRAPRPRSPAAGPRLRREGLIGGNRHAGDRRQARDHDMEVGELHRIRL